MSDFAIRVEKLSKQYRIGGQRERYQTLRDAFKNGWSSPWRRAKSLLHRTEPDPTQDSTIWALRDISFEIKQSEVVGIIGRNGAGKSTLLKLLTRIMEPTYGRAIIRGRVGSLLEVGTGFHAELTGRENIYLYGAILGMRRVEIERNFDAIVEFADTEKFIDTPLKRYSSGMQVRLAFAVAAHLEPEVLLIDEVLAVGDARFQKKCLNKMHDVGQQGRTVIFVSHNMSAITRLCERVILLDDGKILQDGPSHQIVSAYLNSGNGMMTVREWPDLPKAPGNDVVRLCAVRVRTEKETNVEVVDIRQPVAIDMDYQVLKSDYVIVPNFAFFNEEGVHLFTTLDSDPTWRQRPRPIGRYISTTWIPGNLLAEGMFFVTATADTFSPRMVHFHEPEVVAFQVIDPLEGDSARGDYVGSQRMRGVMRPLLQWETKFSQESRTPSLL